MNIRILLADDHRILREGLRSLLAQQADIAVVGEAPDGASVVALARELQPDLVIGEDPSPPRSDRGNRGSTVGIRRADGESRT